MIKIMRQLPLISTLIVMIIAIAINYYFSFSHEPWIVIAAFLTAPATVGTPLRQGLNNFLVMIIGITLAFGLESLKTNLILFDMMVSIIFIMVALQNLRILTSPFQYTNIFFLTFLFAIFTTSTVPYLFEMRCVDILIGSLLGMGLRSIFFSVNLGIEFRSGMVPILQTFFDYNQDIKAKLLKQERGNLPAKRVSVERMLSDFSGSYPEWVYESGFNPGLRGGFRYFLINFERIGELLYALDYQSEQPLDLSVVENVHHALAESFNKNADLLSVLQVYFETENLAALSENFTQDIAHLEEVVSKIIPANLEALDLSPSYLLIIAITRNVKDIREILLQLVMSILKAQDFLTTSSPLP